MWYLIFGAVIAVTAAGVLYLSGRLRRFRLIDRLARGRRGLARAIALGVILAAYGVLALTLGVSNAVIALLHLVVIWLLCDVVFSIVRRIRKRDFSRYYSGGVALVLTAVCLWTGWYLAHHVTATRYAIDAGRPVAPLRVVQIADAHIGALFDAEGFARHLDTIRAEGADLLVITGDFVDDDTSREDMLASCRALADVDTTYGVFFAYGNHDRGYTSAQSRGWTAEELEEALVKNGVTVLKDAWVDIGRDYALLGREDPAAGRQSMEELTAGLDGGRFSIVLDHQPADYAAQEAAGVDLVLSGHTHGGQFFPFNRMGEWTGINDKTYGHTRRGNTHFIVTSGIADWALGFKTGCVAEYVVVDIR